MRSTAWGFKTLTVRTARYVTPNQLPRKWDVLEICELINKDLSPRLALNDTAILAKRFSCDANNRFECMQRVNVSELVSSFMTIPGARRSVVVDGEILPAPAVEMVQRKQFNKVPYIMGNNADEASLFMIKTSFTAAGANSVIQKGFGPVKAAQILNLYPLVEGTDNRQVLVDLMSDIMYHCANRRFALALAEAGAPGWMYSFKRHTGMTNSWSWDEMWTWKHVTHF